MSLKDSYRELELYVEQVSDEIMRVFEDLNLTYNLEKHNTKIVNPTENAAIDSSRNLLRNSDWKTDTPFLQALDSTVASDIKQLLTNYKVQQRFYDEHSSEDERGNKTDSISEDRDSKKKQMTLEYGAYPQWAYCRPINGDTDLLPKSPTLSEQDIIVSGNDLCCKSIDELHTLSWLCWRQWQRDLRIDYVPVVPVLKKVTVKVKKQTCSQLDRRLAEIEATETCKWLRAAGFPQYAQMYEEMQFPVDIIAAQHDHPLLEPAVLQSLFRRLHTLNRCAQVCQQPCSHTDDSEDEQCALSDNWTYQTDLRRWSRNHERISNVKTTDSTEKSCTDGDCSGNNNADLRPDKQEINKSAQAEQHNLLRRAATTRFRHHREGVVSEVGSVSSMSDILLKRLGSIKCADESPFSNLEHTIINAGNEDQVEEEDDEIFDISGSQTNSENNRDGILWNSVQRIEAAAEESPQKQQDGRPMISLSCTQLQILRKLALLKLTAHIEKYCPSHRTGWNWELPKFIKKIRNPTFKEHLLLNLPLTAVLQRTGQPLPRGIQEALEWLYLNGSDQVGLFRKPGVRSRIQALKTLVENQGENINFTDQQPYDVADMIKQYFRELPEAVLTNKLSETFILIFQYVPPFLRKESVLCALLLMPDEHREVLQALLHFLLRIAKYSDVNQMNDSNLAICFAPALFQYSSHSSFYRQGLGSSTPRELVEIKAAQECLLYMLRKNKDVFNIPKEFLNQCKLSEINDSIVVQLSDLGASTDGGWQGYMQECHTALLKEVREKNRGWIAVSTPHLKVELSYKKVEDGHPLRLWKVCADIEAPPNEVLHRILRERHIWDDDLHSTKIIAQMNKYSEVFHYVRRNIAPLPFVDYCVIRTWNTDLPRGTCVIVETSVEHPDIPNIPNTIRGIVLASRYLIEPGGSGRSRLLHLSRVDMRGRMPEWYHKNFGHLSAIHAARIQGSFHQTTAGPESKV